MYLHYLFILGITVEAASGALAAGRKQMDLFGVMIIATITGLGGGSVRDILIGNYPLTWVSEPNYILVTALTGLATVYLVHYMHRLTRVFLILDALGLATFTVIGAKKALALSLPPLIVFIVAVITGVFGGILRDVFCNDIPLVFRKELYAFVAFFGSILYYLLTFTALNSGAIAIISIALIFLVRCAAIFWQIEAPKFSYEA